MFRFRLMARIEEEKTRSVRPVREHFSTTTNAAIGRKMNILKPVLEPALDDYLGVGIEIKNFLAMGFGVAEHRIAGAAKREKAHGGRNSDIDSDHARQHPIFKLTRD